MLRSFHSGTATCEQVLDTVYSQLAIERVEPKALLAILNVQQRRMPLPIDAHRSIQNRITSWPQEATQATASSRDPSNLPGAAAESVTTIVLGEGARPAPGTKAGRSKVSRGSDITVGAILQGRFSLTAIIGEGGMSRVFKAIDLRKVEAGAQDPYVAVKVLTVPFSHYFGSMAALQREAHKLQSLTHENIVRVIDCDRDGQTVFMTMEYLRGESLYSRLRRDGLAGLERGLAINLVASIGNALDYAHQRKIVHGDLKPGNVIVGEQGEVKVIDFGMSRFIAEPQVTTVPRPNQPAMREPTALTPRYASPEMLRGHDAEPADDVYSLACLAYETLTGRHPFGNANAASNRDPAMRPARPEGLPARQYKALSNALAYDRNRRTASPKQFLEQFGATNFTFPSGVLTRIWRNVNDRERK